MIRINQTLSIPEEDFKEQFVQASGPGGQKVNKTASAVQLRFDINASSVLPQEIKQRLINIAVNQITKDGILIIEANRYRSQNRNREAAREKLAKLVRQALKSPKSRKKTHRSKASDENRLQSKKIRSRKKALRKSPPPE